MAAGSGSRGLGHVGAGRSVWRSTQRGRVGDLAGHDRLFQRGHVQAGHGGGTLAAVDSVVGVHGRAQRYGMRMRARRGVPSGKHARSW